MNADQVNRRLDLTDLTVEEKANVRTKIVAGTINPILWNFVTDEDLANSLRALITQGKYC